MIDTFMHNFHLMRPLWLLLLIPFLLLMMFQYRRQQHKKKWRTMIAPHLLEALNMEGNERKWFSPVNVLSVLVVIFIIILAGPSWKKQASPFEKDNTAFYVALNVSESMENTDLGISRLERAKQKVTDLLKLREGKKAGLIVYSGTAHSVLPMTNDQNILLNYLAYITPDIMPESGNAPEKILPIVTRVVSEEVQPISVLLITDGVTQESIQQFETTRKEIDFQLLVLGMGLKSESVGTEPMDVTSLKQLASATEGEYIQLTSDTGDIRQINSSIQTHSVVSEDTDMPWVDSGYEFIFLAMLLILPWFRKGWTLHWVFAFAVISSVWTTPATAGTFKDLWFTKDQQGYHLYQKGEYAKAAEQFTDVLWKGTAYYMAENFNKAAETFGQLNTAEGLFRQANALAHARQYLAAEEAYRILLNSVPDYPGAAKNLAIIQKLIEENVVEGNDDEEVKPKFGEMNKDIRQDEKTGKTIEIDAKDFQEFSAEEILQNEATNEQWMRSVEPNPSIFLGNKFHIQTQQGGQK